ncbi:MAG: Dps family protein [Parachlamydiales bacterium]
MKALFLSLCLAFPLAVSAQNGATKPKLTLPTRSSQAAKPSATPQPAEPTKPATAAKPAQRGELSSDVAKVLANIFLLYTEALNFHWNVVGPQFLVLHEFFGKQYEALAEAVDDLAEQIRIMDATPPSTLQEFLDMATLKEPSENLNDRQMLQKYLADTQTILSSLPALIARATEVGDDGTADLLIERQRFHSKTAWMIRAILQK